MRWACSITFSTTKVFASSVVKRPVVASIQRNMRQTIAKGSVGIFHGMKSYFCQDEDGQIAPCIFYLCRPWLPWYRSWTCVLVRQRSCRIRACNGRRSSRCFRILVSLRKALFQLSRVLTQWHTLVKSLLPMSRTISLLFVYLVVATKT